MSHETDIDTAVARFDAALARLETGLSSAVARLAELGPKVGYEDGFAAGKAAAEDEAGGALLREELASARARQQALEAAVGEAQAALDEAIADMRAAIGPV